MPTSYASIKDSFLEIVERLSKIRAEDGNKRLQDLNEKLTQQQFNLVVMGQFKTGKSTFINALLGAEIEPTAIVPLTSIVTILPFGHETKGVVHCFNDQNKQEVSQTLTNLSGRLSVIEETRAELLDYRRQAESLWPRGAGTVPNES